MGQLTDQPFHESCCDGGQGNPNDLSAQPCGCDPGAHHLCERHKIEEYVRHGHRSDQPILIKKTLPPVQAAPTRATTLPVDGPGRKQFPVASGVLDYFPDALVALARLSQQGNDQHNPGQLLHWDRSKSTDEADTLIRHFLQRGSLDTDGIRHSTKVAWRALALLQKELETAQDAKN